MAGEQQRLRARWRAEHAAETTRAAEAGLSSGQARLGPQARMTILEFRV